ncbi:MAG TPA: hypothetical protein VFC63_25430 [Blastocatellia bacterium]|nr:hypothetical protein [Blastocatellia bacterium]
MSEGGIPEGVKQFLARNINSIAELEVLLLLQRDSNLKRTAAEVARELSIDEQWATAQLSELAAKGLLTAESGSDIRYSYSPKSSDLRISIDQLAKIYTTQRVAIITFISSRSTNKIRILADAFKLKGDTDG